MNSVAILLCIILGTTFLISSVPKLRHPRGFILTVLEYQLLPPRLAHIYAWMLPPLEFLLALLLFTGTLVSIAATVTALLLSSFVIAVGINIIRGRDLDCHCFGNTARRKIGWPLVLEDILLLSAAVSVSFLISPQIKVTAWSIFGSLKQGGAGLLPFVVDLALTGSVTALLRFSKPKRSWFLHLR